MFTCPAQTPELDSLWNIYKRTPLPEVNAQSLRFHDTVFLSKDWHVCHKSRARYYRLVYPLGGFYIARDFYKSGHLQMEALCSSFDPQVNHGKCVYYYRNGNRESRGQYLNDTACGQWWYWRKQGPDSTLKDFDALHEKLFDSISWKPQNQSSLIIVNLNYRYKLNKGILNSGHGFGVELGFNFGYLFSQKLLLAVFAGRATKDLLYNTRYSRGYASDYTNSFRGNEFKGNDSVVLHHVAGLINNRGGAFHDVAMYYGIMLRLPMWYAPVIKIYRGSISTSFKASSSEALELQPAVPTEKKYDHDYYDFTRNIDLGVEVFLYNGRSHVREYDPIYRRVSRKKKLRWNVNMLGLSVYAEFINARKTKLYYSNGYHNVNHQFSEFMSEAFMQKYQREYNIGLRLSWGIF